MCQKQRTSENYAAGYGNLDKCYLVRQGVLPVFHFISIPAWCPPDIMLRNSSTRAQMASSNKIFMPSMQSSSESAVAAETIQLVLMPRVKIDDQQLPCFYHAELCQDWTMTDGEEREMTWEAQKEWVRSNAQINMGTRQQVKCFPAVPYGTNPAMGSQWWD